MRCCLSMRMVRLPRHVHTLAEAVLRQEWIQQRISCTHAAALCDHDDACRGDKQADGRGDRGACEHGFSGKDLLPPTDGEQDACGGTAVKRIVSIIVLNESGSAGVRHTGAAAFVLVMPYLVFCNVKAPKFRDGFFEAIRQN